MHRSLTAAIGVLVVLAVAFTGAFVLTGKLGSAPGGQALSAASSAIHTGSAKPGSSHGRTAASSAARQGRAGSEAAKKHKVHHFLGVALQTHIMRTARSFARITRFHPNVLEIYMRFGAPFPTIETNRIASFHSTPLVQLNPRRVSLRRIDRGKYDKYVNRLARVVKGLKYHVILSFGHEFNGSWNSWSLPHATPAQFVGAWRLIHNGFKRAGVRNVTWSWDPSHTGRSPRRWWPGRQYVDRIGIDGYQRHGQTFREIFAKQLHRIRRFTHKPVFIAETSVARTQGQARQIIGLFNGVRRWHISGFVWFDVNRLEIWRLQNRPAAIRAFRRCLRRMAGWDH